jgi:hypothetical protein
MSFCTQRNILVNLSEAKHNVILSVAKNLDSSVAGSLRMTRMCGSLKMTEAVITIVILNGA